MKRSIVSILIMAVLSVSCTEVVFETPQPVGVKNLSEIPETLIGSYSFVVLNEQQAIHITKDYFDSDEGKKYLSDSLIMRKMGNKYIMNQLIGKEGDTKGKWSVYIFEEKGCGFLKASTFIISEDEYITSFSEAYGGTLVGGGQEKQVIISPDTKEKFNALSKDKNATLSIILEKIEN